MSLFGPGSKERERNRADRLTILEPSENTCTKTEFTERSRSALGKAKRRAAFQPLVLCSESLVSGIRFILCVQKETRLRLVPDDAIRLTGGRWRAGASFHKGSLPKSRVVFGQERIGSPRNERCPYVKSNKRITRTYKRTCPEVSSTVTSLPEWMANKNRSFQFATKMVFTKSQKGSRSSGSEQQTPTDECRSPLR